MIDDIIKDTVKKMAGAIDFARQDFATVRTGRANPAMFNKLEAEYYGTPTPLQQLATFQSPEPRVMLISPFDASALNAIEKAIRNSDLGVNPASDGKAIRVVLPELTEERRKEYIKIVRAKAEEGTRRGAQHPPACGRPGQEGREGQGDRRGRRQARREASG